MLKYVRKCNVKIAISHYSMIIGRHRYTKAICTRNFLRCICLYAGIEELNLVGQLGDYESEQTVEYGKSPSVQKCGKFPNIHQFLHPQFIFDGKERSFKAFRSSIRTSKGLQLYQRAQITKTVDGNEILTVYDYKSNPPVLNYDRVSDLLWRSCRGHSLEDHVLVEEDMFGPS